MCLVHTCRHPCPPHATPNNSLATRRCPITPKYTPRESYRSRASGIGLFTYHKYRKSIESPVPLDAHGNPIVIEDETGDALGLTMGRGSIGGYDDGVGGLSMGGDEERVPLARTMDLEAVSLPSVRLTSRKTVPTVFCRTRDAAMRNRNGNVLCLVLCLDVLDLSDLC